MPLAAPRPCTYPGCGALAYNGTSRCPAHKHVERAKVDNKRGSSASRGYGSKWQKARAEYLLDHPLCVECKTQGKIKAADVVDHKIPHRGDPSLFWDRKNWQSMCKMHHDTKTAKQDGGFGNR